MKISELCGALGAEVRGVDLARLDDAARSAIREAFHEHLVLVFPDQDLSAGAQVEFTELFGSDISHAERPPAVSVLHALQVPDRRGDTMFCNMYRAHDALSNGLREAVRNLRALHSALATYARGLEHNDARAIDLAEIKPPRAHPVVRIHPETGRAALFVNPHFTIRFEDMTEDESRPLLESLHAAATRPDNVYRHRWRARDVVMWDNRCTMHYAIMDYTEDMPRLLHRTTAAGDVPR